MTINRRMFLNENLLIALLLGAICLVAFVPLVAEGVATAWPDSSGLLGLSLGVVVAVAVAFPLLWQIITIRTERAATRARDQEGEIS
jgi:uncharacterized membrane protein